MSKHVHQSYVYVSACSDIVVSSVE
jgi:hypothetical protein